MLEEVRIRQWRACQDVELPGLGQFTALVGRNGVGKTNILTAIEWAARAASSTGSISTEPLEYGRSPEVHLTVRLEGETYRYSIQAALELPTADEGTKLQLNETLEVENGDGQVVTHIVRNGTSIDVQGESVRLSIGADAPALHAVSSLMPDSPHAQRVPALLRFFKGVRYYPLDEPNRPPTSRGPWKSEHMAWRATGAPASDSDVPRTIHKLVHILSDKPEMEAELKEVLGCQGLGLIDDLILRWINMGGDDGDATGEDDGFYYVRFKVAGSLRSYHELSAGTRRIIQMIVSVLYDESSVLMVEHPEDTIHKGLLHRVVGWLRANAGPAQFIVASHSPEVLDQCSADEIRLVTMLEGQTHARRLLDDEVKLAKKYVCEDGSLSEFLPLLEEE